MRDKQIVCVLGGIDLPCQAAAKGAMAAAKLDWPLLSKDEHDDGITKGSMVAVPRNEIQGFVPAGHRAVTPGIDTGQVALLHNLRMQFP